MSQKVAAPRETGLAALESRGYSLLSLPSTTETILHPSQTPHALEMVSIRLALAKAGILRSWKSDLEIASKNLALESGAVKDFDAVAEIDLGGTCRIVGLEYERSPKAASRYQAIREVLNRDKSTDAVLYLAANDDILYVLAMELCATQGRIGFVLGDAFRRSLLETNTLTNENSAELMPLRKFLVSQ